MTREQLAARQAELKTQMEALLGPAADNKVLTAEEQSQFDSLLSEAKGIPQKLTDIEAAEQRAVANRAALSAMRPLANSRRSDPEGSFAANIPGGASANNAEPQWMNDPKRGFKDTRELLTLVMAAGSRGYTEDPRLKSLASAANAERMAAGSDEASTISDSHGGFFIPEGFSPDVLKVMAESDPLAKYVKQVPMNFPTLNFNARVDKNHATSVSGGFIVYRRVETQPVADSRAVYDQVVLNVNSLMGLAYATEEVIERSPISFISLIEDGMRDEFPAKLMKERLTGTGVGQFEGILNSPALVTVDREAGQATTTILFENVIKMSARVWNYGNSVYIANHTARVALRSLVQVIGVSGAAVPLFSNEGGVERLDGRPIIFTEFAPTGRLILANLSQYLEGTYRGMRQAESMHVRFSNHERTFKFWMENDARGWWKSALTPYLGDSMSPFVVLSASAGA